jgi:hypothetical protein
LDIDGAKALKERLARSGRVAAQPASVEVSEGAPPVYHWFSVRTSSDGATPAPSDGAASDDGPSRPDFPPLTQ